MNMKRNNVKVGFSRPIGFNFFSLLIRVWGWTKYSHVFLVLKIAGVDMVVEASHGEVHLEKYSSWLEKNTIVNEKEFEFSKAEYWVFFHKMLGFLNVPYSFKNILGIFLNKLFGIDLKILRDGKGGFICSELAVSLLPELSKIKNKDYYEPKDLHIYIYGEK